MYTAFYGHDSCLQVLLEAGVVVDVQNDDSCTALSFASAKGHVACVRLLLAAGADKTIKNKVSGDTWTLTPTRATILTLLYFTIYFYFHFHFFYYFYFYFTIIYPPVLLILFTLWFTLFLL